LAKLFRHARVEIFVLIRAEPDNVEPSSASANERCVQHPPEKSSPSKLLSTRCWIKPTNGDGFDTPSKKMLIVGDDGE
jgi:hypothetical protein